MTPTIHYTGPDGIERTTDNVWVEWSNGYCWLVLNQWGVVGAVITMEDDSTNTGWYEAYNCAVDEIAHDYDETIFADQAELDEAMGDGLCAYRSNGVPSNPLRSSCLADTECLTVVRASVYGSLSHTNHKDAHHVYHLST